MKKNTKNYRACGQHVNASDDNCTDLARHAFMMDEIEAKPQHAPPPWTLAEKIEGQQLKIYGPSKHEEVIDAMSMASGVNHSLELIARVRAFDEEQKANASFIVRAVNAHEELLQALKDMVDLYEGHVSMLMQRAKQAIAKAEGR